MDREDVVLQEMEKRPGERVFSFLFGGRRIWVKRAEHVYHEAWLRFARRACLVLGLGILQPGADPNGVRAVRFEAGRLQRLARCGMPVPEVFAKGTDWVALFDCGKPLSNVVRDAPEMEREAALTQAAEGLAALHAHGLHHGRPALKDMMWDGERTWLLDFEDGVIIGLSREKRLARDVLLFLQSIMKEAGKDGPALARLAFDSYRQKSPESARFACSYFGAMGGIFLFLRVFLRHTGSDLLSIYEALRLLREERK